MKTIPITQQKEGFRGKVIRFSDDLIAGKLMAMGVLPGSEIEIVKIAPFKGGFYLKTDGNNMAVRYDEAASILTDVK